MQKTRKTQIHISSVLQTQAFLTSTGVITGVQTLCIPSGDLHATAGQEKNWGLQREYERLAWLELVRNRIAMASQLGSDVIIMHAPFKSTPALFRKTIDELRQFAQEHHVRIAIENGDLNEIGRILSEYDPDYVCLCYDSGHGNMAGDGLDHLERLKDRLI